MGRFNTGHGLMRWGSCCPAAPSPSATPALRRVLELVILIKITAFLLVFQRKRVLFLEKILTIGVTLM